GPGSEVGETGDGFHGAISLYLIGEVKLSGLGKVMGATCGSRRRDVAAPNWAGRIPNPVRLIGAALGRGLLRLHHRFDSLRSTPKCTHTLHAGDLSWAV